MPNWSVEEERIFPRKENPFNNPFYGYREVDLKLPDSRKATYYGLVVPACVHVVAIEDDDTTYLIRQSRPNIMPVGAKEVPETLELPGGFADPSKPLSESAQLELEEEVFRHASQFRKVGILYPSVGVSNEQDHIFLGTGLTEVHTTESTEATEQDKRVVTGKFSKLYEQMQRDRLPVSAQTLAAMAKVAIYL